MGYFLLPGVPFDISGVLNAHFPIFVWLILDIQIIDLVR